MNVVGGEIEGVWYLDGRRRVMAAVLAGSVDILILGFGVGVGFVSLFYSCKVDLRND